MTRRRLRILCLHGFRGSGAGLQAQMQPLFAGLEELAECVYVDAPPLVTGGRSWWNATAIAGADPRAKHYEGWAETRAQLLAFFASHGPFDGIFGFSQGAALAALLVGLRAPDGSATGERPLVFEFALLVSGFVSNDPAHAALYRSHASYALPSLHLIGNADRVVPANASHRLAARFNAPTIVEHEGGHVIASSAEVREAVALFLTERRAALR